MVCRRDYFKSCNKKMGSCKGKVDSKIWFIQRKSNCLSITSKIKTRKERESIENYFQDKIRLLNQTHLTKEEKINLLTDGLPNDWKDLIVAAQPTDTTKWFHIAASIEQNRASIQFKPKNKIHLATKNNDNRKNVCPFWCPICSKKGIKIKHWVTDCEDYDPNYKKDRPNQNTSVKQVCGAPELLNVSTLTNSPTQGAFKLINISVEVNGIPAQAFVDTGATVSIINWRLFKRTRLQLQPNSDIHISQADGVTRTCGSLQTKVRIDKLIKPVTLHVMKNFKYPLLIGLDVASLFNLLIDVKDKTIYTKFDGLQNPILVNHLEEIREHEFKKILEHNRNVFCQHAIDLGKVAIQHKIITKSEQPISHRPYRRPLKEYEEIAEQVKELLEHKLIRISDSPWAFPVVMVPKKDGNKRMCIDYRRLNEITLDDRQPLPHIQDMFDRLHGSSFFSTLDVAWGYWQIEMDPQSIQKTAFVTNDGHYEFLVMPFGLKNAASTFQRIIQHILGITTDIKNYVRSCKSCQLVKVRHEPTLGEMITPTSNIQPLQMIGCDTIVLGTAAANTKHKFIQVFVDHATRYLWAYPTITNTAQVVTQCLDKIIKSVNSINTILTDNGKNFISKEFNKFLSLQGIKHTYTSPYHPQCNGICEKLNDTIMTKLRIAVLEKPRCKWSSLLPQVVKNYNSTPHEVTGFSPLFLMYGIGNVPEFADQTPITIEEARKKASLRTEQSRSKWKIKHDSHHPKYVFKEGDLVIRKIAFNDPRLIKTSPKYEGPFVIQKKISDVTYDISLKDQKQARRSNDATGLSVPQQETTFEEEETSPPQGTSADPLTQIADALNKLLVARSLREIDVSPYDGTFEAQSFFDNFDAQADRAKLTYTDRLRKLPCYLQGKPLQYFRNLRLDRLFYIDVRQTLIDLFPTATEASFSRFLAIKLTAQMPLEDYYQNKAVMGMKLNLPADILIDSLTEGLPVADQRLIATVQPNTIKEWFDLVSRIRRTQCATSAVYQRQVDKAPHPTYHNPPPRHNNQRSSRVTYQVAPPPCLASIAMLCTGTPSVNNGSNRTEQAKSTAPDHAQPLYQNLVPGPRSNLGALFPKSKLQAETTLQAPRAAQRKLNEIIAPDVHPLPLIETILDKLSKAKYYSSVDIASAYWQVEVEPNSRYTVTAGTYAPQTRNLDTISAIKPPTNQKTLQSFLGAVNVYNKFIPDYARLRAPLNKLLKKDVKWNWDPDCQQAFTTLKESLTSKPVLHLYQVGLPCRLYCDASTQGIAGILKQSCHTCQIIKRPKGKPNGALGQIPPPQQPFDLISIDTIAGFSKYGHSKTYLHVIVDHLTRYAWTFPSKSTSTLTYIQTLKTVLQQGSPKRLLSDRAPAFTSEKFRKFLITHGIQPLLTTSNNPQANGLIERLNSTITGKLRLAYLENPKASWTQLVKRVTQTYNNTPHSVTSFPPTYLMFNVIPPDLRTHLDPYPKINIAREIANSRTQNKHKKDKEIFDKQHRTPHFEVNDLVLVKNYRHLDTEENLKRKHEEDTD
ncbi:K02A2.6-like, partial [Cordylochernes scorpioides]